MYLPSGLKLDADANPPPLSGLRAWDMQMKICKKNSKNYNFFLQILKNRVGGSVNQVIKKRRPKGVCVFVLVSLLGQSRSNAFFTTGLN